MKSQDMKNTGSQQDRTAQISSLKRRESSSQSRRPMSSQQPRSKGKTLGLSNDSSKGGQELYSQKSQSAFKRNTLGGVTSNILSPSQSQQFQSQQKSGKGYLLVGQTLDYDSATNLFIGKRKDSTFSGGHAAQGMSSIRKSKDSYESDGQDPTEQQEFKALFISPNHQSSNGAGYTQLSNQKQKKKTKNPVQKKLPKTDQFGYYSSDDNKENQQINSNSKKQKPVLLPQKPLTSSQTETLLNENLIQKLKQEVQKQVRRREDKTRADEQQKSKIKQYQQSLKHLSSVIPFDQKELIRQKKAARMQQQEQQQIAKQRQEYEERSRKRKELKVKREQEREEQQVYLGMLRSSMSRSPVKGAKSANATNGRKNDNTFKRDNSQGGRIKIESVDEFEQRVIVLDKESKEDLDDLDRIMTHQNLYQTNPSQVSDDEYRIMKPVINIQKFSKSPIKDSPVRVFDWRSKLMERPLTKSPKDKSAEKEYRHQQLENYLREQKVKRQQEKKDTDQVQKKKFTKLQQQLKGLQRDYFKGLEEFKFKQQRAFSDNKRQSEQKKKPKKKKKPLKRQSSMPKFLQPQKSDYDLINQRRSVPQLILQSPLQKPKPDMNSRGSFQSPYQLQLRQMNTYDNFNPMQSEDAQSYCMSQQQSPKQMKNQNNNIWVSNDQLRQSNQMLPVRDSLNSIKTFNTMSSMPKQQSASHKNLNLPINYSKGPNQKKCILFANDSMKSLLDLQYSASHSQLPFSQQQNDPILDMKADKTSQMFQEFAVIRKNLEQSLKGQKRDRQVMDYPLQQKSGTRKSSKKKYKGQVANNMPLRAQHLPQQMPQQIIQILANSQNQQVFQPQQPQLLSHSKTQKDLSNIKNNILNPTDLQLAKQQLLSKLNQVASKVQKQVQRQEQLAQNTQILQQQLKEDKEEELTTYLSPDHKQQQASPNFRQQISSNVSKIEVFKQDESKIQVGADNTTMMLKRMYMTESKDNKEKAALVIQKFYRGFKCRKIMREKLRIDKEFRMLRQKYEVKSNPSSSINKTLLSSLAFSQSKPLQVTTKLDLKQINSPPQDLIQSLPMTRQSQQRDPLSSQLVLSSDPTPLVTSEISDFPLNNQNMNIFYTKDDIDAHHLYGSVFKSPSIEEGIMPAGQKVAQSQDQPFQLQQQQHQLQNQPKQVQQNEIMKQMLESEMRPQKLQFQESQIQGNNFLKDSQLIPPILRNEFKRNSQEDRPQLQQQQQLIEEFKEDDSSFLNDQVSQRSQLPVDDQTPFIIKQHSKQLYKKELPKQLFIDTDKVNEESQHQQFLDSPLEMKDLVHLNENQTQASQALKRNTVPRPISKNEEIKRPSTGGYTNKTRGISPIYNKSSPQSQFFHQQKSSFDISSLINYGEEQVQDKMPSSSNEVRVDAPLDSGSPLVIEEGDISPSNKSILSHHTTLKSVKKGGDDSSMNSFFDKNSFQTFARDRVDKVFKAEAQIERMIGDLNYALKKKIKVRQQELQSQDLSMRSYNRAKIELEKWVEKEKREIKATKRHFMQGCMRLSSLLEHFVKEQGRVKEAVSGIRRQAHPSSQSVRKSQSFDRELQKQKSNLFGSKNDLSGDFNTVSGRRLSLGVNTNSFGQTSEKSKDELEIKKKQAFEYQPQLQHQESIKSAEALHNESDQLIEIKPNQPQIQQSSTETILIEPIIEEPKSKRQSLDEFSSLEDLSQSKEHQFINQDNAPNYELLGSQDDNQLKLSDTPLLTSGISSNYQTNNLPTDLLNSEEDHDIYERLVDDIFHEFLFRETQGTRLFPPRPLAKLQKSKFSSPSATGEESPSSVRSKSPENQQPFDEQIKVLDNIIEECKEPTVQILEKDDIVLELPQEDQAPQLNEKGKGGIETGILQVNTYMQEIFQKIKTDFTAMSGVLENVSQPLYKDPVLILAHLQNSFPEPPVITETGEVQPSSDPLGGYESPMPFQQSVLSVDLYLDIEKERRGGLSISQMKDSFNADQDNSQSFVNEIENIHNKAIFDAVNEALDGFRPYGLRGPPLPWSKQQKTLTFKYGKEETLEYLLQKVKYKVLDWSHMNAGTLPKNSSQSPRAKDRLELIREERLAKVLIQEAEEGEQVWVDYEYEETQTKLDIADLILEQMCKETVDILNAIKGGNTERVMADESDQNDNQNKQEEDLK